MLSPQQILKCVSAELADHIETLEVEEIPVAVHTFSARIVLNVQGSVKQCKEQNYTPTCEIPLLAVLARFAEKAGVVGPALLDMLAECASEALANGEPVGDSIEHTKKALAMVRDRVTEKLPKKQRKGALRRALSVEMVECVPIQQREAA